MTAAPGLGTQPVSYVVGSEPGASNVAVAADQLRIVEPPTQECE